MPSAMLRACAEPGCPELTRATRCPAHEKAREAEDRTRRGTATERGYDSRHWRPFRERFKAMLIQAGIAPVCGASLPGGPAMTASRCRAEGRLVERNPDGSDLHVDHDPPLTDAERSDWRKVCDVHRVGLLCKSDHAVKTAREQSR